MRILRDVFMTAFDLGPWGISTTIQTRAFCPLSILFLLGAGAASGRLLLPVQLVEAAGVGGRIGSGNAGRCKGPAIRRRHCGVTRGPRDPIIFLPRVIGKVLGGLVFAGHGVARVDAKLRTRASFHDEARLGPDVC